MNSEDLKYPPTPVGGIQRGSAYFCRKDLNNPPTAVGGISIVQKTSQRDTDSFQNFVEDGFGFFTAAQRR